MARPKFEPTEEQRRTVKSLAAYGINQEGIAHVVCLRSPKTLRKHFSKELILGEIEGVAQVAQTNFQMAKSGKHAVSTIHFLEKRQRWLNLQTGGSQPETVPEFVVILEKKAA
jgi:hypothetical protein